MSPRPAILLTALVCACVTERPAPPEPTWVDDVQPILKANCFQCHGASADPTLGIYRWDVYDLTDPRYADVGFPTLVDPDNVSKPAVRTFVGARDLEHYPFIRHLVSLDTEEGLRMPPPPATRLSARDVAVLENWSASAKPFQSGSHQPNHPPTIRWLQPGRSLVVEDQDGDQVLGRLDCGGQVVLLPRSGGHQLMPGVVPPCTGKLFDGWDAVTVVALP
jgi:hypothetical protein